MLKGNLQKVGEHGQNTSRTLKAMEEMLKDRSGGIVAMDLMAVIRQDKEMLHEYFSQEIRDYNISTVFNDTETPLLINGNADQLSKAIMSLLGNAIYAVVKKAQKCRLGESKDSAYTPKISLEITQQRNAIHISIRDNGIGIEETIIDKIFDPFFTTKTTSEAAGVGLYLSKEIVQNHGGDIQVKSVKDEYSDFTITLPVKKA
jgi:signal transduction histidine kinase